jgi:protease I
MADKPLAGTKVAVLVESQYIPEEIEIYRRRFADYGADVHLMSRLWGQPKQTFVSEVENAGESPQTLEVDIAIEDFFPTVGEGPRRRLSDYAAIIMAANYTSVRLRYFASLHDMRTTPAVRLFADAMADPRIIKGALCHGLWILTPRPELLAGRKVIGHEVVQADIANAGGVIVSSPNNVVVDGDLVTGKSYHETAVFVDAIRDLVVTGRT